MTYHPTLLDRRFHVGVVLLPSATIFMEIGDTPPIRAKWDQVREMAGLHPTTLRKLREHLGIAEGKGEYKRR